MTREQWDELFAKVVDMPVEELEKIIVDSARKAGVLNQAVKAIRKLSADVQPVRHGRWKLEKNWDTGYEVYVHVCTACNAITPVNVSRYRYCPNCGAKLDLEDSDGK